MNNLKRSHLYLSISISCALFIVLYFVLGPNTVFGLSEFIQNKTGYFFGVGIDSFDYFLIASLPILGLLLSSKKKENNLSEILKNNLILLLSCIITFSLGLFILLSKIGSPAENPLLPQYLRMEPFNQYSSFFIALGIFLSFLLIRKAPEETESEIEEIGRK